MSEPVTRNKPIAWLLTVLFVWKKEGEEIADKTNLETQTSNQIQNGIQAVTCDMETFSFSFNSWAMLCINPCPQPVRPFRGQLSAFLREYYSNSAHLSFVPAWQLSLQLQCTASFLGWCNDKQWQFSNKRYHTKILFIYNIACLFQIAVHCPWCWKVLTTHAVSDCWFCVEDCILHPCLWSPYSNLQLVRSCHYL